MLTITATQIQSLFSYEEFIPFLAGFLGKKAEMPQRGHYDLHGNTLLLMPAWDDRFCGVKIAAVAPGNSAIGKPSIHAVYTLFDVKTGEPLAQLDGQVLTTKRTAAASALASSKLSRADSDRLLVMGSGALYHEMIAAHATVRSIREVQIWGRNPEKTTAFVNSRDWGNLNVRVCRDLPEAAANASIITCVTPATQPILFGKWLCPGTHLDLVGSYRPDLREADDEAIQKAKIFVDTPTALLESGDIFIPLQNGTLRDSDIAGTLKDLASGQCDGRTSAEEITLFKSVGFALEDLAAAEYLFSKSPPG